MNEKQEIPQDIINSAEKVLYYNNLLIEQCDRWLSAEEGNRNMMRAIEERRRKEKAQQRLNIRNKLIKHIPPLKFLFKNKYIEN